MSKYNDTGMWTSLPDAAIPLYSRVKKTATGVAVAGATDKTFGSATREGYAATTGVGQEYISVKMATAPGTHYAIAGDTIDAAEEIEGGAAGVVMALASGDAIGQAMQAAVVGQVFEVVYYSIPIVAP